MPWFFIAIGAVALYLASRAPAAPETCCADTKKKYPFPPLSNGWRPIATQVHLREDDVLKPGEVVKVTIQEGVRGFNDDNNIAVVKMIVESGTTVGAGYTLRLLPNPPSTVHKLTAPLPTVGTRFTGVYPRFIQSRTTMT